MTAQMSEAMKTAKQIQQEMVQWENRNESLKAENDRLAKANEILQTEIAQKTSEYQTYIANREKSIRDAQAQLAQDQKTLEAQRDEFKANLQAHLKEKESLANDRMFFEREKARVEGIKKLNGDFIQAVRRAYSLIGD